MSDTEEEAQEAGEKAAGSPEPAKAAVGKGTRILLAVIGVSLVWYLLADRYTPYTSQARVQGYVVGVAPKVAGLVTEVWVKNNGYVKPGQSLFQIDQSQYKIALEKARSDLETARRQVDAGSASVEAAQANLEAAQANQVKSQKDTNRLGRLFKEDPGTISVRRLEISRATLDQSIAAVAAAEAGIQQAIEQMGGQDEADNAKLKAAHSAVEKAELDLANTMVTASSQGLITDLRAEVGQYAGTGSPVLTLVALDDIWVSAQLTENSLGHLDIGSRVEIAFDVLPGRVFEGKVRSVGRGVSAGQPPPVGTLPTIQNNRDWLRQSQRFPVAIEFDLTQAEDLGKRLGIGGQAAVIVYTEGHGFLNFLGRAYIRVMSFFSYAY